MNQLFGRTVQKLDTHVWHVPDWLDQDAQHSLAKLCHLWTPAGFQRTQLPNKKWMSVETACLGWHWYPYGYSRFVDTKQTQPVPAFPNELQALASQAIADTYGYDIDYSPDTALLNKYNNDARQGMHQDSDERCDAPVVSISLGATATFRFGNTTNRNKPWQDIELRSGDLFVFGGSRRFSYHGVPKVHDDGGTTLTPGTRLNITIRQVEPSKTPKR